MHTAMYFSFWMGEQGQRWASPGFLGSYVIPGANIAQFKNFNNILKGLSHDIDYDNDDENLQL